MELDEKFFEDTGGGYTFLAMPMTKDSMQWGEQFNANELMMLSIAAGWMEYLLPRVLWHVCPGSVPYVVIHNERKPVETVTYGEIMANKNT